MTKKTEQVHKPFTVRLSEAEINELKKAAIDAGMTAGKLFVHLVRKAQREGATQ